MARLPQHVRKIETPRGPRFETRINSTGRDGARQQLRKRFTTAAAAVDWHRRTSMALADGAFVTRSSLTVKQACEAWLAAKELRTKPTTTAAYTAALAPVIQRYGRMPVQSVTRSDVETLIAELVAGSAGRVPWKRTSINPMLARWRAVWSGLHADGTLPRNVVALVEPLRKPAGQSAMKIDDSLTAAEADKLLAAHTGHPHEVFLQIALLGLRRGDWKHPGTARGLHRGLLDGAYRCGDAGGPHSNRRVFPVESYGGPSEAANFTAPGPDTPSARTRTAGDETRGGQYVAGRKGSARRGVGVW